MSAMLPAEPYTCATCGLVREVSLPAPVRGEDGTALEFTLPWCEAGHDPSIMYGRLWPMPASLRSGRAQVLVHALREPRRQVHGLNSWQRGEHDRTVNGPDMMRARIDGQGRDDPASSVPLEVPINADPAGRYTPWPHDIPSLKELEQRPAFRTRVGPWRRLLSESPPPDDEPMGVGLRVAGVLAWLIVLIALSVVVYSLLPVTAHQPVTP